MEHFNGLTPAEDERLALLLEECGETIQIIGKILRHGYSSCHPEGKLSNRDLLMKELGDVQAAIQLMYLNSDIFDYSVNHYVQLKKTTANKYLHHNKF